MYSIFFVFVIKFNDESPALKRFNNTGNSSFSVLGTGTGLLGLLPVFSLSFISFFKWHLPLQCIMGLSLFLQSTSA